MIGPRDAVSGISLGLLFVILFSIGLIGFNTWSNDLSRPIPDYCNRLDTLCEPMSLIGMFGFIMMIGGFLTPIVLIYCALTIEEKKIGSSSKKR